MYYFKNASIEKTGKVIIDNLNWEIENNQNWAIVGPTGSGKTTLLEALSGKCLVKGEKKLPLFSTLSLVSNAFDGHYLLSRALQYYQQRFNAQDAELAPKVIDFLMDNLKPVGTVNEKSVQIKSSEIDPNGVVSVSKLFKVEHLLERAITSLSNGETRRTLLAKALLKKPQLLLLDNPFVGLDVSSRALLHQVLNDLMISGIRVILVTTPAEIPSQITNVLELSSTKQMVDGDADQGMKHRLQIGSSEARISNPDQPHSWSRFAISTDIAADLQSATQSHGSQSWSRFAISTDIAADLQSAIQSQSWSRFAISTDTAADLQSATQNHGSLKNIIDNSNTLQYFKNQHFEDFVNIVSMRNVNVQYGNVKVLKNLNWTVLKGEKWAVLGPNGAGKSTLLSLITADNPQGYANDYDLFGKKRGSGESIWDIKQKIGYLSPELHNYFPRNYTCFQVVASGLFDRLGIKFKINEDHHQKTLLALQLLNLEHLSLQNFGQISAGQQRLILLSRALVKNPPLLILDEPCQGLDHENMVYFRNTINLICKDSDRTLLYVTHYEEEIPVCVTKRMEMS